MSPSPPSPLLSISGLEKKYGQHTLLHIDRMTIAAASAYVVTGINGAGKSTLLRILCGLEPAKIAQASFQGRAILFSPYPRSLRDAIGYVHQQPAMFASSVAGNIGYGLKIRGVPPLELKERVNQAMQWAGVSHLSSRQSAGLSGGEKQRIALARAKILKPTLLLLDEPTANLDGAAREQVLALIPALIAEGSSVIMACHDRDLIGLPHVHRLKLRDGRLEQR